MSSSAREYQHTHPWINFSFDIRRLDPAVWIQLGQIQAKCDQVSGTPLLPAVAERLHTLFLAKGVRATTAIEGNTLTEDEVLRLLAGELKLPPSREYLAREAENIVTATKWLAQRLLEAPTLALSPDDVRQYNATVLSGLASEEDAAPGQFRSHDVRVGPYKGAPAQDVPWLVSRMCDWLNSDWAFPPALKTAAGILKSIVAHVYVAWIHPFADGNGRTARLVELHTLMDIGFPSPTLHLLSNHYNQTRTEYYRFLDISSRTENGLYRFIEYALQGLLDNLDEQIRLIETQQLEVHWQNYVYDQFRHKESKVDIRRRRLVLAMGDKAYALADIRYLTPQLAEAYADKSLKTLQRDVSELSAMGLLVVDKDGISANKALMQAFRPVRRG
ncbi:MAG: Fic family protein [Pleurocapsa minor GSE-CHR-MK-17-07R]|jgi:Fic family protein|nr:Fic family protein [Pleurocapsa minor GSE-CHR-MK 17-07R]